LLLSHPGFDSIDMTSLGDDMLAHNYFSNDSSALVDMMTLFWQDVPPERRCGVRPREGDSASVYEYRKGICPSNDMIGVISNVQLKHLQTNEEIRSLVVDLLTEQSRIDRVLSVLNQILFSAR
jgi:hypothetical protein